MHMHLPPNDLMVHTGTAHYPVIVEYGARQQLPYLLKEYGLGGTLWLVSDSNVFAHYGAEIQALLSQAGHTVQTYVVPSGEASKSQEQLWQLYTWMISNGVERRDTVLALGGGMVGDLAGFAAASVLRGIALVQLPTTLLAMVDAAVGGKTGINHPLGKNLIGAFHQPRLVLADTATLQSLPGRELRSGWAEVIKHGVIRDAELFALLEAHAADFQQHALSTHTADLLTTVVRRAVAVKVAVVSADEREQGVRIILNYGHTLGHALEATLGYQGLLHGEAVAIGMHAVARIAVEMGVFAAADAERQRCLLEAYGLPTRFPTDVDLEQVLAMTLRDKKVKHRQIRWVLPVSIGTVSVRDDVPEALVRRVLLQ